MRIILLVDGSEHFPYIGKNNPNWLIFFRGVEITDQPDYYHTIISKLVGLYMITMCGLLGGIPFDGEHSLFDLVHIGPKW